MIDLLAGPWGPLIIFGLRVIDVSLGTVRLVLVTRGAKGTAALIGFAEVLIWLTASASAILNLTSPWHVVGYAGGFAAGTWSGMWIEERIPMGTATVQAFCREADGHVARALRNLGLGVTVVDGEGVEGPVEVVSTVVRRRMLPVVIETIEIADADAFITIYDARVRRGFIPPSYKRK